MTTKNIEYVLFGLAAENCTFFFFFTNIYIYKAILSVHFESFSLSFPPIRLTLPANYPTCFNLLSSLKLSLVCLSHIFLSTFTPSFCTSSSYSTIFLSCLSLATSFNPVFPLPCLVKCSRFPNLAHDSSRSILISGYTMLFPIAIPIFQISTSFLWYCLFWLFPLFSWILAW